jgi:hypothetical protein
VATTRTPSHSGELARTLGLGAIGGMIAATGMAMYAMLASVTYQHHGFFTPLFHISALAGTPNAMMTSAQQAMIGNRFWFTPGAALAGLFIHMMTGAAYGMLFTVLTRALASRFLVFAGFIYGLAVFALSSFGLLPLAAAITNSDKVITHMARVVGWPTFAIEHMMFGVILGTVVLLARNRQRATLSSDPRARTRVMA